MILGRPSLLSLLLFFSLYLNFICYPRYSLSYSHHISPSRTRAFHFGCFHLDVYYTLSPVLDVTLAAHFPPLPSRIPSTGITLVPPPALSDAIGHRRPSQLPRGSILSTLPRTLRLAVQPSFDILPPAVLAVIGERWPLVQHCLSFF